MKRRGSSDIDDTTRPPFVVAPRAPPPAPPPAPTTLNLGFAGGRPSKAGKTRAPLLNKSATPLTSNAGSVANPNTTGNNSAPPNAPPAPKAMTLGIAGGRPSKMGTSHAPPPRDLLNKTATPSNSNAGNSSTDKHSAEGEDDDRPPPPEAKRKMGRRNSASGDSIPLFATPSAQGTLPGQPSTPTVFAGPLNAMGSPNTAQGLFSTPTTMQGAPNLTNTPNTAQTQQLSAVQPQPVAQPVAQLLQQPQIAPQFQPQPQMYPQFGPQPPMAQQHQPQPQMYQQSSAHLQYHSSWLHYQSLMPARPALTTSINDSPAIGYLEAIEAQRVAPEPVYHWTPTATRVRKASQLSPIRNTPAYSVTKYTPPPRERIVRHSSSSYIGEPPLRRQRTERKTVEWRMLTPHDTVKQYRQPRRLITIDGRIMLALGYYAKTDLCSAYIVALAVLPCLKIKYLHEEWQDRQEWIVLTETTLQPVWETDYRGRAEAQKHAAARFQAWLAEDDFF
ncbi:hypothetical protein FN846DRAFT_921518 [Sphaerosporella brunnea]|uniref:Uncharacterized protein n=1 Tax=Sphaerosporella brunnea TaxID=1250544 RepID=A0A5J5EN18_9PEZI|nr:hypothetical protein FN846DRAFT_921518 [Sphaerosporella brunnea]